MSPLHREGPKRHLTVVDVAVELARCHGLVVRVVQGGQEGVTQQLIRRPPRDHPHAPVRPQPGEGGGGLHTPSIPP